MKEALKFGVRLEVIGDWGRYFLKTGVQGLASEYQWMDVKGSDLTIKKLEAMRKLAEWSTFKWSQSTIFTDFFTWWLWDPCVAS